MSYRTSLPLHPTEDDKPKRKKKVTTIVGDKYTTRSVDKSKPSTKKTRKQTYLSSAYKKKHGLALTDWTDVSTKSKKKKKGTKTVVQKGSSKSYNKLRGKGGGKRVVTKSWKR